MRAARRPWHGPDTAAAVLNFHNLAPRLRVQGVQLVVLHLWYIALYQTSMVATLPSSRTLPPGEADEAAARIAVAPLADTSPCADRPSTAMEGGSLELDIY